MSDVEVLLSNERFPSPYGDFVFQQEEIIFVLPLYAYACFRPLTGILFFNVKSVDMDEHVGLEVSVPLRGFCFSTSSLTTPYSTGKVVSVPLRGFCFSTEFRQL